MSEAAAKTDKSADPLLAPLLAGDRRALAQAITLIESTRADHRERADALLAAVLPHTGKSVRLGITGVPGVGKSTFIERFGLSLIDRRDGLLSLDQQRALMRVAGRGRLGAAALAPLALLGRGRRSS